MPLHSKFKWTVMVKNEKMVGLHVPAQCQIIQEIWKKKKKKSKQTSQELRYLVDKVNFKKGPNSLVCVP